jgi:putative ABC transport system permease protein
MMALHNHKIWQWHALESTWADVRFALGQFLRAPGMSLLAILSLALGVGASTAMFTVIESVLLRSLPYSDSDRLIFIGPPSDKPSFGSTSWLNYRDIRAQSTLLRDVASYSTDVSVMETNDGSQPLVVSRVTTNLFSMLGARPLLGRTFSNTDGQSSESEVVLLSENIWRQRFHAQRDILGQTVKIGDKLCIIIGVMPDGFRFPESIGLAVREGVWLPMRPSKEMLENRGYKLFNILGELRPGVSVAKLQSELDAIATRIRRGDSGTTVAFRATPYKEAVTGRVRPVLYALFGALALLLLIACANVSNLLLARSLSRRQEFAVRVALGAGRMRLTRQMLTEGLTLSLLGCSVGILVIHSIIFAVRKLPDGTVPRTDSIAIDWTVVLVLGAIAMITAVLSSVIPAVQIARCDPQAAIQSMSREIGFQSFKSSFSGLLVTGEVAFSTVLLVATGLLFHTLWNLEKVELGFDSVHLSSFTVIPPDVAGLSNLAIVSGPRNSTDSVATITYQPVLDRIRRLPDIAAAALITTPPLSSKGIQSNFEIIGQPTSSNDQAALVSAVSGDYGITMGTPVLHGRMLEDGDVSSTPFVTVVNEALAKKYFGTKNPIGKEISLGEMDPGMIKSYAIVGVLADQVEGKVGAEILPLILLPQQQIPTTSLFYQALLKGGVSFVVKTRGDVPLAAEMRSIFHANAPGYTLDNFQAIREAVDQNTFSQRLALYLVGSFAGIAVVMVLAGLYGVLTQFVGYRRHEIGLRMALGATRKSVVQLILRHGAFLIGSGLVVGMLLAIGIGRLVKSFLYQVQPTDALTYAAVTVALSAVGLLATLLPACSAASIEPMQALRTE